MVKIALMGSVRVGINGMGRIGRTILREWAARNLEDLQVVACNNPGVSQHYAHLLKYDSVHGIHPADVAFEGNTLSLDGGEVKFFNATDPREIPWAEHGVEVVIDATGIFVDRQALAQHLGGTVKKVVMCAPGKNLDGTFVMGINHQQYLPDQHHVISNASCTTNCLAPIAQVLDQHFSIESGLMTTVHAYTLDQMTLDAAHKDMRRARAAALNMIPTTTGAAKMVGAVIPSLEGKLDGYAVRVPIADVSLLDLSVNLKKSVTGQSINEAMAQASESPPLRGILAYSDLPLVSQDFIGRRESAIYDAPLTNVIGHLAKVTAWYDNEVGFSNRVIDLARYLGQKLREG